MLASVHLHTSRGLTCSGGKQKSSNMAVAQMRNSEEELLCEPSHCHMAELFPLLADIIQVSHPEVPASQKGQQKRNQRALMLEQMCFASYYIPGPPSSGCTGGCWLFYLRDFSKSRNTQLKRGQKRFTGKARLQKQTSAYES